MPDILKRLGREVLVVDGAMGTMLQRAGVPPEQCPEELNVMDPQMVLADPRLVHHGRRRVHLHEHVRCFTRQARGVRARRPGRGAEPCGRAARPGGGRAAHHRGRGSQRAGDGAARVRDLRRGVRHLRRADRALWPRSVPTRSPSRRSPTSPRSAARCSPRAVGHRPSRHRVDDLRADRPHGAVGDRSRDRRRRPPGMRGDRRRDELRTRTGADAAARRGDGGRDRPAAHRPAQRRASEARRRHDGLPRHAG